MQNVHVIGSRHSEERIGVDRLSMFLLIGHGLGMNVPQDLLDQDRQSCHDGARVQLIEVDTNVTAMHTPDVWLLAGGREHLVSNANAHLLVDSGEGDQLQAPHIRLENYSRMSMTLSGSTEL